MATTPLLPTYKAAAKFIFNYVMPPTLLAGVLLYSSCQQATFTDVVITNDTNTPITLVLSGFDDGPNVEDTVELPAGGMHFGWTFDIQGRANFTDANGIATIYDTIIAVQADTLFTRNLIDATNWQQTIRDPEYWAVLNLSITNADF